jgi:ribonuclease HIII
LVQGTGAQEFVVNILEPMVLGQAVVGYENVLSPEAIAPHMGIDESGKGDFFGPMVIAAAYTNEDLSKTMQDMGVRDSKQISSDAQALRIGSEIRKLLGPNRYTVVRIGNATYNRLYAKMRSVNRLLAWSHARCIENLLNTVPSCPRAVSDQFGSKEVVERALMQKGRKIVLEQRHKAESDIAVAAASILAREGFLRSLVALRDQYGQEFPKGASPQVRAAAVALVGTKGPGVLIDVAKCHFRTTDAVLAAAGHSRDELPPEGRVVSQDTAGRDFRRPASSNDSATGVA